jgi:hypothetical protein
MWLPTDHPVNITYNNLKRSHLPEFGYLRVLNSDNEAILFIKEGMIVGSWCMDVLSLDEFYENKAMKMIKISADSNLELYDMNIGMFDTLLELNEECKLSLPIEIDLLLNEIAVSDIKSREDILAKYRIKEPSDNDLEGLLNDYKSKV